MEILPILPGVLYIFPQLTKQYPPGKGRASRLPLAGRPKYLVRSDVAAELSVKNQMDISVGQAEEPSAGTYGREAWFEDYAKPPIWETTAAHYGDFALCWQKRCNLAAVASQRSAELAPFFFVHRTLNRPLFKLGHGFGLAPAHGPGPPDHLNPE